MAEKHKSKYKEAKDMAKSQKAEARKDIKDYTADEAHGMVPNLAKGVVPGVARKYATDVINDVENMVPEIKERLYKKVEEGEYSPKHARKVFEKLQIEDTDGFLEKLERIDHGAITNYAVKPSNEETIKESLSRLTEEQKEKALRKYLRAKIAKTLQSTYLIEQEDPAVAPEEEAPEAEAPETKMPTDAPAPEAPVPTEPEAEAPAEPEEMSAEEKAELEIEKQKKAKKEFLAVLETEKASDTVTHYVELGLEPLLKSMKSLSGKKFEMAKIYAKRMIDKAQPSTVNQDNK